MAQGYSANDLTSLKGLEPVTPAQVCTSDLLMLLVYII